MNKIESALLRTRDTKALIIGEGAAARTGEMFAKLFPGCRAIAVADTNTWRVAGEAVMASLEAAGIGCETPFIITDPALSAEWHFVEIVRGRLAQCDAVAVAIGSGVINDLVKYASSVLGRKYMCVGTAASVDGHTAYGASLTKDGNKQTFDCPAAYGFILDSTIAAAAPRSLVASGYADLIAKIPAGIGWILADVTGNEKIDRLAWDLVQYGLRESLSSPEEVHRGDVKKTEKLAEGLLMCGFAMQIVRSSRPASGAEHLFAHCWDMENLCHDGRPVSHGFKVGIGTLASVAAIEFLLEKDLSALDIERCVEAWPTWEVQKQEILRLFADNPVLLARALEETERKYIDRDELRRQLTALREAWPQVEPRIREMLIPFGQVRENLRLVGAPYEPEQIGVSRERLRRTLSYVPYMRDRYTVIDVIHHCGYMEELAGRLFGRGGVWEIG